MPYTIPFILPLRAHHQCCIGALNHVLTVNWSTAVVKTVAWSEGWTQLEEMHNTMLWILIGSSCSALWPFLPPLLFESLSPSVPLSFWCSIHPCYLFACGYVSRHTLIRRLVLHMTCRLSCGGPVFPPPPPLRFRVIGALGTQGGERRSKVHLPCLVMVSQCSSLIVSAICIPHC